MTSLVVDALTVRYPGADNCVVDGVGFTVGEGETVAIAGVSGSGKTQTVLAVTRLLDTAAVVTGSARFGDVDLLSAPEKDVERVRGAGIGMVFQDPAASLNPHRRVGDQLRVILEHHGIARGREARRRVIDMLQRVQLPDPKRQARAYPHELSGGMRQRVMIAAALIAQPSIVIADEPTTALDTTVQAQILELLKALTAETGVGLLLITHDLGIIAENAERMLLLDRGRLVEQGPVARVFAAPDSDAMRALLQAADAAVSLADAGTSPVLELSDYAVSYRERRARPFRLRRRLDVVKPIDIALRERETLALVGESGSGKTSLARSIAGLIPPARGRARLASRELAPRLRKRSIDDLRGLQMVFQDPAGSFDPARRVGESIAEPLRTLAPALGAGERRARALTALERAGLDPQLAQRFPHQLSGGQAQRAAVARALIADPALLICDEPVAALDGPVRQRILGHLAAAQRQSGLAILFITHDLDVVRRVAHRVAVLYLGRVVEFADRDALFSRPRHPYTRALIDATPRLASPHAAERRILPGEPGSLLNPPSGCVFHPRCAFATGRCRRERPLPEDIDGVRVACHHARELDLRLVGG